MMIKKNRSSSLSNRRNALIAGLLASAAVAAIGADAAVTSSSSPVPEIAVRERAMQRWQALIAGKYEDAYEMLAPGVRAVQPYKVYRTSIGGGVTWTAAEVVRVDCNDAQDNCAAVVRVESKALFPGMSMSKPQTISTHIDESWIKQDGQWWLFPKS